MRCFFITSALVILVTSGLRAPAAPASPFAVSGTLSTNDQGPLLSFTFKVPAQHVLYADKLAFETGEGEKLTPRSLPSPVMHTNELTKQERLGYESDFTAQLQHREAFPAQILVRFQGCSNNACYFPEKHLFSITAGGVSEQNDP